MYGTAYPFKTNCVGGNESPSFVSDNEIIRQRAPDGQFQSIYSKGLTL